MSAGPHRGPVRYDVPPSNGTPKSAASSPGSSRVWGRRMKVAGWANLGERNESAGRKSGILILHAWMHRDYSTRPRAPSPVQSLRGRVLSCHCEARSVFCHCEERSDEAISGQGDRHALHPTWCRARDDRRESLRGPSSLSSLRGPSSLSSLRGPSSLSSLRGPKGRSNLLHEGDCVASLAMTIWANESWHSQLLRTGR